MLPNFPFFFVALWSASTADLQTAAITVYRNPEFFRHLSEEFNNHLHKFTTDGPSDDYQASEDDTNYFHQYNTEFNPAENYNHNSDNHENYGNDDGDDNNRQENSDDSSEDEEYKYPGEPKKPNPPAKPDIHVHYDPSPDFEAPPRDVPTSGRQDNYDHGKLESIPEEYEPIETKKGTREYLKQQQQTMTASHELEDLRSMQPGRVSCMKKRKKPRTYIAYKLRPVYPRYRVIPTVYFVNRGPIPILKRRRHTPKTTHDDSAYVINSALDDDYQRVLKRL